jgi:NAD(P)H-nitrite reductase large subunit
MEIVIVGNSAGAIGAIEAIRKVNATLPITVISEEPYPVYSRPLISYLLSGEIKEDQIFYRSKNFYEKQHIKTRLGRTVTKVDFEKSKVELKDGEKIPYDRLLIAMGGIPFIPKIEGVHLSGVSTFTKLDDAKKLLSILPRVQRAIVVGGGLIGLKVAEALKKRGVEVTVVELANHILNLTLDETASLLLEKALEKEGIHLMTSTTVEKILGDRKVESVHLSNGKTMNAQLVILAIGVVPNVGIFKDTPLQIDKGILVNERMETNLPHIYAAGDVTQSYDKILKMVRPLPIWPNAYHQGKIAGYQMVGREEYQYEGGFTMNSIEVAHLPIISIGLTQPPSEDGYQVFKKIDRRANTYRKIILKEDRVVGAILMGEIDRAGIITGLLREGLSVKGFKKELLKNPFGWISFPKHLRKERLGKPK